MSLRRVVVVGGGAAGFFAAISCAEAQPGMEVLLLEKGPQFLSKVRVSGGGRCNLTHAGGEAREMVFCYPRGGRELWGPLTLFQAADTIAWFESRGVKLKTESDGRVFPASDSSAAIIDCLLGQARPAGVKLLANTGLAGAARRPAGGFELTLADGATLDCERLLLATGGCSATALDPLPVLLGHTIMTPVPSIFSFEVKTPWVRALSGVSVETVEVSVPGTQLHERGALLLTHDGLSGPVILALSAWGAQILHDLQYQFPVHVDWLPLLDPRAITTVLCANRKTQPARQVVNSPLPPLPARLWEQLVLASGLTREIRWAEVSRSAQHHLLQQLIRSSLFVTGKAENKDEFVTCGGVRLDEINFKTMESRICPGLYFAGEILDIDGITGGYNLQAAWTTGWIAGHAMASGSAPAP